MRVVRFGFSESIFMFMSHKPRLARSVRVFLRREKARIRVTVADEKEQEQKIEELMKKFY